MVLFLHHRYRILGGEEQAAQALASVVRDQLGEEVAWLERASSRLSSRSAAAGVIAGGLRPEQVAAAVRRHRARIVHAHNLQPTFGWRALAAARDAGARVVLHLHQYRLVCAIGVAFRDGQECRECHGRNTLPGVRHNCRGRRGESLAYATGLAAWQRATLAQADAVIVPSQFARGRLIEFGLPLNGACVVPNPVLAPTDAQPPVPRGGALVVSRLAPEKGVDVALTACARSQIPLTIAGDGPERRSLEARAQSLGADVTFLGHVPAGELAGLRRRAAVAIVPSRSAETFGLAAAEAMSAGVPVVASRIGALPELVPDEWLAPPGDAERFAALITRLAAEPGAGERGRELVERVAGPQAVAGALRVAYEAAFR